MTRRVDRLALASTMAVRCFVPLPWKGLGSNATNKVLAGLSRVGGSFSVGAAAFPVATGCRRGAANGGVLAVVAIAAVLFCASVPASLAVPIVSPLLVFADRARFCHRG